MANRHEVVRGVSLSSDQIRDLMFAAESAKAQGKNAYEVERAVVREMAEIARTGLRQGRDPNSRRPEDRVRLTGERRTPQGQKAPVLTKQGRAVMHRLLSGRKMTDGSRVVRGTVTAVPVETAREREIPGLAQTASVVAFRPPGVPGSDATFLRQFVETDSSVWFSFSSQWGLSAPIKVTDVSV